MQEIYLLFAIIFIALILFVWGFFRYDLVALITLMALVITGLISSEDAFIGFSNSAVISVAAVMVISAAVIQSGVVEYVLGFMQPKLKSPLILVVFLCLTGAFFSAFMNNVGALTLLMPVAIQSAIKAKISPSKILMPLSFATVLGGMITKIGTPPNLIISAYKENITGKPFAFFDFAPTGLSAAIGSLLFIILLGWRFLPPRRKASDDAGELYNIHDYISEISIPKDSLVVGMERRQLENLIEGDFSILGLIRGRKKKLNIPDDEELQENDVLIIEASHDDLNQLILKGNLELSHGEVVTPESLRGKDISTIEAVVTPGSRIQGRSWQRLRVRSRFGLNLLAVARSGKALKNRLNHVNFNSGDVLLVQGATPDLRENVVNLGLVPLAERTINVGLKHNMILPLLLFIGGILLTAFQILAVEVAFTLVVVAMVVFNVIPMRQVYKSIDWSIIMLLGALIPLGQALQTTGASSFISSGLLALTGNSPTIVILGLLLFITMTLSDVMNNSATAIVMAPIGAKLAEFMHLSPDPFLMAISIGASCSFLTPISHQNNTLVMGPGGYQFQDYFILGIPVELIVMCMALPALYFFWL